MKRFRTLFLALLTGSCHPVALAGLGTSVCGGTAWYMLPKEVSDNALLVGGNVERVVCGIERLKTHSVVVDTQIDDFCEHLPEDLLDLAEKGVELWKIIKAERAA